MADGTSKAISKIKIGDEVLATDPLTNQTSARKVTAVWIHDDTVVELKLANGESVTTTEDHPFWNATDKQWQQAQQLDSGDHLLTADGATLPVAGLNWLTQHTATAYNLTVAGTHTYYVLVGSTPVLVHNDEDGRGPWGNASQWAQGYLPQTGGPVNGVYYKVNSDGAITNYAVYDESGNMRYRTDLVGATHRGVATPHTQTYAVNTDPKTGRQFVNPTGEVYAGVGPDGGPTFGC